MHILDYIWDFIFFDHCKGNGRVWLYYTHDNVWFPSYTKNRTCMEIAVLDIDIIRITHGDINDIEFLDLSGRFCKGCIHLAEWGRCSLGIQYRNEDTVILSNSLYSWNQRRFFALWHGADSCDWLNLRRMCCIPGRRSS